ncbi:FAD binding domain-containing protein [Paenibacillus sp. sgz302251]|uniref:FAD binding domain-containing protein n=1 Tax=Paenibacillus sp. sgz302251 TaxID=3414493 RepID=UPI003C7D9F1C
MGMHVQETIASPLVWHPLSAEEAWRYKQTYGTNSVYVAGSTLLRTQWEAGIAAMPPYFIDLSRIRGLNEMRIGEDGLQIGSQTNLQTCCSNMLVQRHFPMMAEALRSIAAPAIRNLATIGGNVASMVGDSIAALLAYDAVLVWYNGQGEQEEELAQWLLTARQTGNGNEKLLLSIKLPFKDAHSEKPIGAEEKREKIWSFQAYHKIGRREAFTPSVVTAAVSGVLWDTGRVQELRIAVGGGQTIARRLEEIEQKAIGKTVDTLLLRDMYEAIIEHYEPREDVFASAAYRKRTAANLIVTELWQACNVLTERGG